MSNGATTRLRRSQGKILAAAEEVFLQHGFPDATMDAVAEKAAVSKQTVYAHFKSKEALFIRVVDAMTGSASIEIGEHLDEVFDDRPVKDYLIDVAIDQLTIVLTPWLMRLRRMVIGEVDRFPDIGRSLYTNGPMRSIKRLTRAFEHYAGIGQLELLDPEVAANRFNWIVMGAPTSAAMLLGDEGIPSRDQLHGHAKESVRIFLCAYAPQGQPAS
jgi:TetR/AcrR family transcriptional regulator, mexJK operon transcriptional repressor